MKVLSIFASNNLQQLKLKEAICTGPQVRKINVNGKFEKTVSDREEKVWLNFKCVVKNFLGTKKDPSYKVMVADLLEKCKLLGELFPENLKAVCEEKGNKFYQAIEDMKNGTVRLLLNVKYHVLVDEKKLKVNF